MKKRKKLRLKKWFKLLLVIILLLSIGFIVYESINNKSVNSKKVTTTTTTKKPDSYKVSMIMTGDCLLHDSVYTDADNGDGTYSFEHMFTEIKPLVSNYDLAYYNQESIIGGKNLGLSNYPRFNSPDEIGDDMVSTGFNLVSLANNHTMDKNEEGVIHSVNYWKSKNVYYTGQALSEEDRQSNIKVMTKNGIKYAFLSYTTVTNGLLPPEGKEYLTNIYSEEKAKADIDSIKDQADLIIVAMHWGVEYQNTESTEQHTIANYLSSLGVNLIIGTHPHVLQPIEMIGDTLVFYSLGNFLSSQNTTDRLTGALASLNIEKKEDKIVFSDIKINLIYTKYNTYKPYNFKIYPYTELDASILSTYRTYYEKYKEITTSYDNTVEVISIDD